MTCNALGLNPDAAKKFIADSKPTYPQFEAWIKKQPGVRLDKATIYKHNQAVLGYIHDDNTRKGILGSCGLQVMVRSIQARSILTTWTTGTSSIRRHSSKRSILGISRGNRRGRPRRFFFSLTRKLNWNGLAFRIACPRGCEICSCRKNTIRAAITRQ